jgi:hypothetical protein
MIFAPGPRLPVGSLCSPDAAQRRLDAVNRWSFFKPRFS